MSMARSARWLLADRVVRAGVGFAVGVVLARTFGPDLLGRFSYAAALVAMLYGVVGLGLHGLVVRDLASLRRRPDEIVTTVLLVRVIAGLLAWTLVSLMGLLGGAPVSEAVMVGLLGGTLVTQASAVFDLWFQAQDKAHAAARLQLPVFLLESLALAGVAIIVPNLILLATVRLAGACASAIRLYVGYRRCGGVLAVRAFRWAYAKAALSESWPIIVSSGVAMVYLRSDQVMLRHMVGAEAVGQYALATGLAESWAFLPVVIVTPLFPALVRGSATERRQLYVRIIALLVGVAFACSVAVCAGALLLVQPLYGEAFAPAAMLAAIYVWGQAFLCVREGVSRWLLIHGALRTSLFAHSVGAVINVGLNAVLIPSFGAHGAAVATVIAYAVSAYAIFWVLPNGRTVARAWHEALPLVPATLLTAARGFLSSHTLRSTNA